MRWREGFWPRVCEAFQLEVSGDDQSSRQYRLELVDVQTLPNVDASVYKGEMARLGSFQRQRP